MNPERTPESIAAETAKEIHETEYDLEKCIAGTEWEITAALFLRAAREIAALEVAKSGAVEALRRCDKIVTYLIESGACNGQITTARNKARAALSALRKLNPEKK